MLATFIDPKREKQISKLISSTNPRSVLNPVFKGKRSKEATSILSQNAKVHLQEVHINQTRREKKKNGYRSLPQKRKKKRRKTFKGQKPKSVAFPAEIMEIEKIKPREVIT